MNMIEKKTEMNTVVKKNTVSDIDTKCENMEFLASFAEINIKRQQEIMQYYTEKIGKSDKLDCYMFLGLVAKIYLHVANTGSTPEEFVRRIQRLNKLCNHRKPTWKDISLTLQWDDAWKEASKFKNQSWLKILMMALRSYEFHTRSERKAKFETLLRYIRNSRDVENNVPVAYTLARSLCIKREVVMDTIADHHVNHLVDIVFGVVA